MFAKSILIAIAALAMMAAALPLGSAVAEGEQATKLTALGPEPGEETGTVVIRARLNLADEGYPLASRTVRFLVDTEFFGNRPLVLEGITDGSGVASVVYNVAWEGEHRITALYSGSDEYLASESDPFAINSDVTGIWEPAAEGGVTSLSPLTHWALWAVLVVWLGLLGVLAAVIVRVVWTIRGVRLAAPARTPATAGSPVGRGTFEETSEP